MKLTITRRRVATGALGATAGLALLGVAGASAPAHAATVPDVLAKIRYCESGNNYQAQNPSSSASGAYQFLTSTWQSLSASSGYATAKSAPAAVQDAAAIELYNAQGTSPWAASRSCWSALGAVPTTGTSGSTATGTATSGSSTSGTATSTGTSASTSTDTSTGTSTKGRATKTPRPASTTVKKVNPSVHQGNRTDHDRDGARDCAGHTGQNTGKQAAKPAGASTASTVGVSKVSVSKLAAR